MGIYTCTLLVVRWDSLLSSPQVGRTRNKGGKPRGCGLQERASCLPAIKAQINDSRTHHMYSLKYEAGPMGSDLMSYHFACNFVYLLLITKHMKASPGAGSSDSRSCLIWLGLGFWPGGSQLSQSGLSIEPGGGQVRPLCCTALHTPGQGDGSRLSIAVVNSANFSFLAISRSHACESNDLCLLESESCLELMLQNHARASPPGLWSQVGLEVWSIGDFFQGRKEELRVKLE